MAHVVMCEGHSIARASAVLSRLLDGFEDPFQGDKSMGFAIDLLCLKIGEVASKKTFGILLSLGSLGCL